MILTRQDEDNMTTDNSLPLNQLKDKGIKPKGGGGMNPEDKVVSLKTAKAFVKAGIVIESERIWVAVYEPYVGARPENAEVRGWILREFTPYEKSPDWLPAPDATELLEWLPNGVKIHKGGSGYTAYIPGKFEDEYHSDVNPAEALAQLALYLKKEGILS